MAITDQVAIDLQEAIKEIEESAPDAAQHLRESIFCSATHFVYRPDGGKPDGFETLEGWLKRRGLFRKGDTP